MDPSASKTKLPIASGPKKMHDPAHVEDLSARNEAACSAIAARLSPINRKSTSGGSSRRILIELGDMKDWSKRHEAWYTLRPVCENRLDTFLGTIVGPRDTPYEGGIFHVQFKLGAEYPFKPPEMWFLTKVLHPNIDERGTICMKLDWSPSLTMEALLASAASLLDTPWWFDPMPDGPAAPLEYEEEKFDKEATRWTKEYATGEVVSPGDRKDGFCNTTESASAWVGPVAWIRRRANSRAYGLFER